MKFSIKAESLKPVHHSHGLFIRDITAILTESDSKNYHQMDVLFNELSKNAEEYFINTKTVTNDKLFNEGAWLIKKDDYSALQKEAKEIAKWAAKQEKIDIDLSQLNEKLAQKVIEILAVAIGENTYRYDSLKQTAKSALLNSVTFFVKKHLLEKSLEKAEAQLYGMTISKDLGNAPGNVCTPKYLAYQAKQYAEEVGASATIFDSTAIAELGMGSFLSVAKGSAAGAYLIELQYKGTKDVNVAPIVLVGKGITFDSGGISLKPGANMDEMKFDMCGAASVIGTFCAAAKLKLPINLVAIVPTCENMPSGEANKPGDVVKSMKGLSIEILNTDAEGRLILCDALTYAERFNPQAVIDVATLTGACIIALGHVASGVLGNNEALTQELLSASKKINDKAWELPIYEEYKEQLKSNFADLQNIGGRPAGTITAAAFLSYFTEQYAWAHLDIAGTAWLSGSEKGATGRPVPMLLEYLYQKVAH